MRHFTDALFEDIEENTLASIAELQKLLPAYATVVDQALKNAQNIEYDAKPKLESSGYILPNGVLINGPWEGHLEVQEVALQGLPEQIRNKVYNDADEYQKYMDQMIDNESNLIECVYKNAIRVNSAAGNTYISIDLATQPLTSSQLSTLEDWLDLVLYANKEVDVTVYESNTNQDYFRGILTLANYDSRDIINLIKYVQTNKRPPSGAVWEAVESRHGSRNNYFTDTLFEDLLLESADAEELDIKSPEELLDWMKENITYELANDEYETENDPPTKTAEEVLKTKSGHCAEQSYLEKKVLDELSYETQLIFVKENNSEDDYGADGSAHLFLTYIDEDDKHCWFEHSMEHMRGIHKYDSEEELLQDVAKNWWRYDENSDTLEVRFIPEPITGVDNWGLAQKCHEYPVETTFDISGNVLEKDTLNESLENIVYKDISDLDHYKKSAKEILGSAGSQSDNGIMDTGKEIYIDDKLVGYISFEDYDDVEGYNKVLGFGNFMILERGKGYGTKVIKDLVDRYKSEFDLIYCFVDAKNSGAINLYKKLGNVYDEEGPNDNGQYYVTFWDKPEKNKGN